MRTRRTTAGKMIALLLAGAGAVLAPQWEQALTADAPSGFQLAGLHSPATVAESIFVYAPGLPGGAVVTYLMDEQPLTTERQAPFWMGGLARMGGSPAGFSVRSYTRGSHVLRAVAVLADGTRLQSDSVTLQVISSLNEVLSPLLTAYPNQPGAQQSESGVLLRTSTAGASLTQAEVKTRDSVLWMYMNWGVDPSRDATNDQSALLLADSPKLWAATSARTPDGLTAKPVPPMSMLFSPDAPFYQPIPAAWPRVALPNGYIKRLQLNTNQQGDGIGFGEVVAGPADPQMPVVSQWYGNLATRKTFLFPMPLDWFRQLPAALVGDRHMIFVSMEQGSFLSSYKTVLNPASGGADALYSGGPTPLGTLGDRGGSVAAGFAELPLMIQPGEATDPTRKIGHAIGGPVRRVWAARVFPASSRDDGVLTRGDTCGGMGFMNTGLVPYGGVIQLDPKLNLSQLSLSLPARRILEAMQTYGYYAMDYGCADLDIYTAIPETELDPFGGLWGYNRKGPGVQNEVQAVLVKSTLYVVAPLTKKQ